MNDLLIFVAVSLLVAFLGGRHWAFGEAIEGWIKAIFAKEAENFFKGRQAEASSAGSTLPEDVVLRCRAEAAAHASNQLRVALEPPHYSRKKMCFWFANVLLCVSAFFILPWYFAVAFPGALFVAIRLFCSANTALNGGFKDQVESRLNAVGLASDYSDLHDAVKNLKNQSYES